jgi:hypothetical protein
MQSPDWDLFNLSCRLAVEFDYPLTHSSYHQVGILVSRLCFGIGSQLDFPAAFLPRQQTGVAYLGGN